MTSALQTPSRLHSTAHPSNRRALICVICGSAARGYNFGAITCMSCKIFFRRNALTRIDKFTCQQGGDCEINEQTRRHCTYCRLVTCFQMGMKKGLIRKSRDALQYRTDRTMLFETAHQRTDPTLNRPIDSFEWSIGSHVVNNNWILLRRLFTVFESLSYHVSLQAHEACCHLVSIGIQPLKIRFKGSYIYHISNIFISTALEFIKYIPEFALLPPLNRQVLLIRHSRLVIMFYAHYQMNLESIQSLSRMPSWISSVDCLLSPATKQLVQSLVPQVRLIYSTDPYLIQLILIILAFTTNSLEEDPKKENHRLNEYQHTYFLYHAQQTYINLLWQYMLHRFGESSATNLFSSMIKIVLRSQLLAAALDASELYSERRFNDNMNILIDRNLQAQREANL